MTRFNFDIGKLIQAVKHAREKHPWPCYRDADGRLNHALVVTALMEEVGEVAKALLERDWDGFQDECYDAIAVLVRLIEGE